MCRPRRNVRTASFRERFDRLPEAIRRLAVLTFREFVRDPASKALRWHKLQARASSDR